MAIMMSRAHIDKFSIRPRWLLHHPVDMQRQVKVDKCDSDSTDKNEIIISFVLGLHLWL